MNLTFEQEDILDIQNENLIINALAGSGKTTTLKLYAEKYPNKKFLYLCYNKSIEQYAKSIFPKNVKTQTFHSLAYVYKGKNYQHRLGTYLNQNEVIKFLDLEQTFTRYRLIADCIINTINIYCANQDKEITSNCVDKEMLKKYMFLNGKTTEQENDLFDDIASASKKLWNELIKPESTLGFSHDFYLKILCNDAPEITKYDTVLIDEAQDLTPCFIDFLNNQKKQMILVGDKYQAIYSWRGAVNYIEHVNNNSKNKYITKNLSQSFRFGNELAKKANPALNILGCDFELKGFDNITTSVLPYEKLDTFLNKDSSYTFIARSNMQIYELVLSCIEKQIPIYVDGGINYGEIKELEEFYNFSISSKSNHPLYSSYENYNQMLSLVTKGELKDHEILKRITLVNQWGTKTPNKIKMLKKFYIDQKEIKDKSIFKNIAITVHKAKGKEYENVILLDDFNAILNPESTTNNRFLWEKIENKYINKNIYFNNQSKEAAQGICYPKNDREIEELNILYVAMTRAKKSIIIPKKYLDYINGINLFMNNSREGEAYFYQKSINFQEELKINLEKQKIKLSLNNSFVEEKKEKKKNKI